MCAEEDQLDYYNNVLSKYHQQINTESATLSIIQPRQNNYRTIRIERLPTCSQRTVRMSDFDSWKNSYFHLVWRHIATLRTRHSIPGDNEQ